MLNRNKTYFGNILRYPFLTYNNAAARASNGTNVLVNLSEFFFAPIVLWAFNVMLGEGDTYDVYNIL